MEAPVDASASMDIDHDSRVPSVPSSPPMSPGNPQEKNGGRDEDLNEDSSPVPPPHWINTSSSQPSVPQLPVSQPPTPQPRTDAEACKVLGNKYFIQRDFKKAIGEYTKGGCPGPELTIFCFLLNRTD